MSELILYTTDDGQTKLHLRVEGDSIWLSQLEITELFQTEPPRLYRRLHILRGWSYELTKTIFPRSPGASCSISP